MLFVVKNILFIVMSCYFRLENSLNLFHHFLCWVFFFFGKQVKFNFILTLGKGKPVFVAVHLVNQVAQTAELV